VTLGFWVADPAPQAMAMSDPATINERRRMLVVSVMMSPVQSNVRCRRAEILT
jgi:hypothetical protein